VQPQIPAPPAVPRGRRPPPDRHTDFDHLAIDELRAYRTELAEEESRVSYWRRVLQARVDIVRAGATGGASREALRRLLSSDRVGAGRTAVVTVVPASGIPPLPHLDALWDRDPVPGDDEGNAAFAEALAAAEQELSGYRRALHERIDAATRELVARYREHPALAVRALPLTPPVRARSPRG
jgi:hypothetical protein